MGWVGEVAAAAGAEGEIHTWDSEGAFPGELPRESQLL